MRIAPCGINCAVCRARLREKRPCPGCAGIGPGHPKTRALCAIRLCEGRRGRFCSSCREFPCERLERLDRRYRTRYGVSVTENLIMIREIGVRKFLQCERKRWMSPRGIRCMHDGKVHACNF